jgi:DNA-binding transcriptional LysR family regulator
MTLNIRQLRALSTVVDAGSVTAAAERLRLTQSAVSRLIGSLEQEVGFPLFDRQKRKMVPTEQAYRFLAEADRILAGLQDLTTIAQAIRDQRAARVRIIAIPPFTHEILPQALVAYRKLHPEVRVHLEVRRRREIPEWFHPRQFDFAVTGLPFERDGFTTRRFEPVEAVAVLPSRHPLAHRQSIRLADLASQAVIALTSDTNLRAALDQAYETLHASHDYFTEVSSSTTGCAMAAAGLGIALVDPFTAHAYAAHSEVVIRRVSDPAVAMHYGILTVAGTALSLHATTLIEEIEKLITPFARAAAATRRINRGRTKDAPVVRGTDRQL